MTHLFISRESYFIMKYLFISDDLYFIMMHLFISGDLYFMMRHFMMRHFHSLYANERGVVSSQIQRPRPKQQHHNIDTNLFFSGPPNAALLRATALTALSSLYWETAKSPSGGKQCNTITPSLRVKYFSKVRFAFLQR